MSNEGVNFKLSADTSAARKDLKKFVGDAKADVAKIADALNASSKSRKPGVLADRKSFGITAKEAEKAINTFTLYENEIDRLNAKEKELDDARRNRDKLKRTVRTNQNKLDNLQPGDKNYDKRKSLYEANIAKATEDLGPAKDRVEQLNEETTQMKANLNSLLPALEAFANKFLGLDETGRSVDERCKAIKDTISGANVATDGLAGKQAKLNSNLDANKQSAEQAANANSDLVTKTAAANTETAKKTEVTKEEDNSLKALIATTAQYRQSLQEVDAESEQAKTLTQQLAASSQELVNRLAVDPTKLKFGELATQLNEFKQAQRAMVADGTASTMSATYQRISDKIEQMSTLMKQYQQSMRGIPIETETISRSTNKAKNTTVDYGKAAANAAKTIKKSFSSLNGLVNTIRRGFSGLSKTTSKVKSSFDSMARSMRSNFKHMITSITKYVLGFRSLFFLVRRLRKYIGEGIQNMAQFNDGNNHVNESITRLLSSLLFLKNAWATAFSPILQVVTPILEALIDKIAEVGNAFSRFLGSLLGVTTVFQAVKVDAADYAKGLDKAGGSAGRAADKTKKLTDRLAAFDDLNVLGKDNDPDGTKSGGGGGGADAYTPDPNEMFKLVDVGGRIKAQLLEMWNNADFTELGDIVKDKIVSALQGINWGEIQTTAYNIGKSIITFLNGALAAPTLWETAGSTIGELGNTITQFLTGIFNNNDINFGGGLFTLLKSFFDTFDWNAWNALLEGFASTLVENINSFFTLFNADSMLGDSILSDIEGNAASLTTAIVNVIEGLDYEAIFTAAVGIADAILGGVQEGLQNSDNPILQSFGEVVGSIKDVLDTLAPVLEPILLLVGEFVQQLLPIISENLPSLAEWISSMATVILPVLFDLLNLIMPILSELVTMIFPILQTVLEAISPILEVISSSVLPLVEELLTAIMPLIEAMIGVIEVIMIAVADTGASIIELIAQALRPLMPAITILISAFVVWFDSISAILEPLLGLLPIIIDLISIGLTPLLGIIGLVATVLEGALSGAFKFAAGIIQSVLIVAIGWLKVALSALTDYFAYAGGLISQVIEGIGEDWNSLTSVFKSVANSIIGIIESMVNNMINGLNTLLSGIDDIADVAESAGINVPKITKISTVTLPRLAQGAVIPPNKEFMAVLGDQSHGTNVEAPLDTIKQAVAEVMGTNAGNQEVIQLLQQLITVVENKNLTIGDKEIGKANARYTNQQRMIRGTSF